MEAAYPFRHWILDDLAGLRLPPLRDAAAAFPSPDWPHWLRYDSAVERKRACEDLAAMPAELARLVRAMQSPVFVEWLRRLTRIGDLQADPTLRGGGLHASGRGDFLDVHLDYQIHPTLHLERRLNAILFLSDWQAWGGELELWSADAREKAVAIAPRFGRLVLFECSDLSYHGCPEPITCPADVVRKSVAVYYLSPPRGRRRALFVPRRRESH